MYVYIKYSLLPHHVHGEVSGKGILNVLRTQRVLSCSQAYLVGFPGILDPKRLPLELLGLVIFVVSSRHQLLWMVN